jgi:hypothetical protein
VDGVRGTIWNPVIKLNKDMMAPCAIPLRARYLEEGERIGMCHFATTIFILFYAFVCLPAGPHPPNGLNPRWERRN